jgi:hypothetical protein
MKIDRELHPHLTRQDFEEMVEELKAMECNELVDVLYQLPMYRTNPKLKSIVVINKILQEVKDLRDTANEIEKLIS